MGKYCPLKRFLQNSNKTTVVLSFNEIERILDFPLCHSASIHSAWWANDTTHHTHAKAWLDSGWMVESATEAIRTHKVTFMKINGTGYEKTKEKEKSQEQQRSYTNPQEIFTYFNCPYPCNKEQLKKSYRNMIGQYHPDKVNDMGPEIKKLADEKTKEINAMYDRALKYFN